MFLSSFLIFFIFIACLGAPAEPWPIKPYRALLVVEKWNDPSSVLVDHATDVFQPVAALLKAWSVPFDILRLDQQHLDNTYLLDRSGQARYGVIVWLADPASYASQDVASLEEATQAGTSLLVCGSRFLDPALERLLGLKFREIYSATDPLRLVHTHFITQDLVRQKMESLDVSWQFPERPWVEPRGGEVLIDQNHHAVLTVHQLGKETSAIWMGVPNLPMLRDSAYWRSLFFRSLLWSLGYIVRPNIDYSHSIEIEIDDWGTSDKGYLSYWRYLEPSEETIRKGLITPLQKRQFVVAANVITGYVDRKTKRILTPWDQEFTDLYGLHQDYASTRRGLREAVEKGVVEIECHGWTHMQPDLESPPGPWWSADLAGEGSTAGWYTEFGDERRGQESPAIVQLFHIRRGLEYLRKDFGQQALELRPGGSGWSRSQFNNTGRVAAKAGLGLFHAEPDYYYYLDPDLVLDMTGVSPQVGTTSYDRLAELHPESWPAHPDGPAMLLFHDRDIAMQSDFLERLLEALPASYRTVTTNQYIGLIHTQIDSLAEKGWQLAFNFDDHYCAYFGKHASSWQLWLSDPLRDSLKNSGSLLVSVDGKADGQLSAADLLHEPMVIDIPGGLRTHVWGLTRARQ